METKYITLLDVTKNTVSIKKFITKHRVVLSVIDPIDVYCGNNGATILSNS